MIIGSAPFLLRLCLVLLQSPNRGTVGADVTSEEASTCGTCCRRGRSTRSVQANAQPRIATRLTDQPLGEPRREWLARAQLDGQASRRRAKSPAVVYPPT